MQEKNAKNPLAGFSKEEQYVLGKIYSWNFTQALASAKTIPTFNKSALAQLEQLSSLTTENGWQANKDIPNIRLKVTRLIECFGLSFDANGDWRKKTPQLDI